MERTMARQRDIFKTITCPGCGGNFKGIPGNYGYYRCTVCKGYEAYELNGQVHFVDRWGDMDEEEDMNNGLGYLEDRPPVCQSCGSDCYPDCKDSCSFFDD